MALAPVPTPDPTYYFPRCKVVIQTLFDDQVATPRKPPFTPVSIPASPGIITAYSANPRNVEVMRNSARKADTAVLTLDYRDFPLDPRIVKDVIVTVHMESVLKNALDLIPTPFNSVFIGRGDMITTSLGELDQSVRIEARDFTGIWLDFRWPKAITIPGGPDVPSIPTPPGTALLQVVEIMRATVVPLTKPAIFDPPNLGFADVNKQTGAMMFTQSDKDDNAWDVLSAICDLFGLVPVYNLDQLTIRSAVSPGTKAVIMEYGTNVERLEFSRNLKAHKSKQVKITAWNPELGIPLSASWPPTAEILSGAVRLDEAKKPKKPTVEQVLYHVVGPYDPATLLTLAQRMYAELSHSQLMGEIETPHMVDLIGGTSLVGLSNGDQLAVRLGPKDFASIASMSPAEAIAFLSDPLKPNNLPPPVASTLVQAWTQAQNLSIVFFIHEVKHVWDQDNGYKAVIGFRDFVLGV